LLLKALSHTEFCLNVSTEDLGARIQDGRTFCHVHWIKCLSLWQLFSLTRVWGVKVPLSDGQTFCHGRGWLRQEILLLVFALGDSRDLGDLQQIILFRDCVLRQSFTKQNATPLSTVFTTMRSWQSRQDAFVRLTLAGSESKVIYGGSNTN
jgi:hypothetical protein